MKKSLSALISLLCLGSIAFPALAQSQRYPTDRELQQLIVQFRRNIPKLEREGTYLDRRTPAQKRQVRLFAEAWAKRDPAVASFLGGWSAIEESMLIYPSHIKGRVCILETYIGDQGTGVDFSIGTAANGRVRTTTKQILVRQGNFLGTTFVVQGKPGLYEYAQPRPLENPATVNYLKDKRQVIEQFNQAGCTADLPF